MLIGADVAVVLKENGIPILAVREGSIDVESEVQVNRVLHVSVCLLSGTFSIVEILNDDPDFLDVRIGKRISKVPEMVKAVKAKLAVEKRKQT